MFESAIKIDEGETILKESANNHFLRPGESSVGRLCHAYLTERRLLFREALYDIAQMKEIGTGAVLHEIHLKDLESAKPDALSSDPAIKFDVNGFEGKQETVFLCFRDRGWHLGEPERLDERDYWLKAIEQRLKGLGRPLQAPAPAPSPPSPLAATPVGTLIAGKYELLQQIGEGGMGHVFLGKDRSLSRFVAVKKMRPELLTLPREVEMFLREAHISASLHHPFITDIYEILQTKSEFFLIFEYLEGKTLEQAISDKGRMPPPEVIRILKCVCSAMTFAHSHGVAHRDLKPSNVMLTPQGFAKVMDFGVARHMKELSSRAPRQDNAGTLAYMAPEQELGKFGPQSDLFSLGATAYEMLSGEMPFTGPNFYLQKEKRSFPALSETVLEAPVGLLKAVERCLEFDPQKRFAGIADFAQAIGATEGI